jgi:hypothetical protein
MAKTDVAACRARQEEAALYFLEIFFLKYFLKREKNVALSGGGNSDDVAFLSRAEIGG